MGNGEDAEGVKGVFLRRNVVNVAGRALKYNLTRLGPLVLPYSQLVCPSKQLRTMFFREVTATYHSSLSVSVAVAFAFVNLSEMARRGFSG